ncbi:chain-length determining protein [Sphingomonas sp. Leaf407]|uniref:XrtA system polysaccharide chain length determinant n=1 Tax=unclassified Sphingomonas TaxID=196159 RepID=UPI0006FF2854|nr:MULTISPECIES: XrtA system polysaccharide chain length determinant [unclassified Sphingomonas]KQN36985.1 chain-length determining protein [Sphingomonas sp. Leaf42]KQT30412.1 chain-length determining protein [Sphingomonas sp. Leaf407]
MEGLYDELRLSLHAIWQRRWIALAIAWVVCLGGWLAVSQIPNSYQSTARVLVQMRQVLPGAEAQVAQNEQAKDIDRVRQTLTSAVNLEKVVRGTSMADSVSSDADVADRVASLQNAIKLTAQQDNLFEISATSGSPKLAREIVQKMIDIFVEDNLSSDRDATSQSLRFLDQQIAQRQKQLADAESRRQAFEQQYMALLPGTGSVDDRMSGAREQLAQIEGDLAAAQSSLNAANAQMAGTAATLPGTAGSAIAGPARARLSAIEGQIAEGRSRGWTDSHPDMVALNRQLASARGAARSEGTSVSGGTAASPNPLYLQLRAAQAERQARVAELNQRKSLIDGQLNALQSRIAADPQAAAQQSQLDRDIASLKTQYDTLFQNREQVRLQSSVQTDTDAVKFSVIDPPTQPRAPTAPNRPLLLLGVLIVGLGAGVAAAFALSRLRTSFATAGKLEKVSGMPVLGSIGEVVTDAVKTGRARRLKLFAGGAGALGVAFVFLLGLEFAQRGLVA